LTPLPCRFVPYVLGVVFVVVAVGRKPSGFVLLIVWGDAPEGLRPAALIFGYLIFGCRLLFAFEPPTSRASSVYDRGV
jgi:hypothetical protein